MTTFDESVVESAALGYLRELGYATEFGPTIGPGGIAPERASWDQVYLLGRLRPLPGVSTPTTPNWSTRRSNAFSAPSRSPKSPRISASTGSWSTAFRWEHRGPDGQVRTAYVRLIDFTDPSRNDWLAVNQFTIVGHKTRRPDVLIFVNGIPLGLLELKNPADPTPPCATPGTRCRPTAPTSRPCSRPTR